MIKKIFSGLFLPKNTNKKTFDFLTKSMDSPLWDILIFLTFLKPDLSDLKNDLFDLICQKNAFSKTFDFLKKPWTIPFGKFRFDGFFFNFSGLKSVFFHPELQKTNFFWSQKYPWENILFSGQNHGLIPLENFDFSDLFIISLFRFKKHSFVFKISKKNLFYLNLPKRYLWENIRFFKKNYALTPVENFDFMDFFETSLFWSKKHSSLPRTSTTQTLFA